MDESQVLSIQILGGFSIHRGDEALTGIERPSLQKLLVFLLLHRGQAVNRSKMAFTFWPDSNEKQALSNLRNLYFQLRHALPDLQKYFSADRVSFKWHEEAPFILDAAIFEDLIDRAKSNYYQAEKVVLFEKAVKTYLGELLPGHYEDWLLVERKRFSQHYKQALTELVSLLEQRRQYQQAVIYVRLLIQNDPLHEPAYAHLMRVQALMDDRAAAIHTYHTYANLLDREMGVEPGPLVQGLYHRLLKRQPSHQLHDPIEQAVLLVGRNASWEILRQTWRKSRRGPQMILIKGEAGIGKTHLAEAFVEWVKRQGLSVLRARCFPTEEKLAYAPVISLMRDSPLENLDQLWLQELMRLLPEIKAQHPELDQPEPITKEWQRLRLFEALAKAIMAGQKPLLLFIDDLQWCDRETLDWLAYLLNAFDQHERLSQLLVIAALRTEDCDPGLLLEKWQEQLIRADRLVIQSLGPLDEEHTLKLANHAYGRPIDPGMSPALFHSTEGHPFFIVELMRSARLLPVEEMTAIITVSNALPDRVRQVLKARLAQLSPLAREVIEQASVIGREFSFSILAQVTHLSEDGLVGCLDECWQRRIIRELGDSAYDFSHEKLRCVVYDSLSETRRRWLHKQVAQTLEKVYADEIDRAASVIAGHYEAAAVFEKAITYYQKAAKAAKKVYALEEELAALDNGLRLLSELPAVADRKMMTAQLQEYMGDLKMVIAAHQAARSAYQVALANTSPANNLDQARLVYKIGRIMESERVGCDEILAQLERAEVMLGEPKDDRDSTWWEVWCDIQLGKQACVYWWQHTDRFDQLINQTRTLIEAYGTPIQQAFFNIRLMNYKFLTNKFYTNEESVSAARAAVEALPESADDDLIGFCRFSLGFSLIWFGKLNEADYELCEAFKLLERTGNVTMQVRCLAYWVVANRLKGETTRVEELANRCLTLAQSAKMYDYIGVSQAGLSWVALQRADPTEPSDQGLEEAARLAQKAVEAWEKHGSPYSLKWMAWWPLIRVALVKNQLAEAIAYAREMFGPNQQAPDPEIEPVLKEALAAWEAEKPSEASKLLTRAMEKARKLNFA